MSESWKVELVFSDGKSNKFWRARTDGGTMYVNFGRIGTNGQTQVKEFGSASEAEAAMTKQAGGKRKKGYGDDPNASGGAAPAAPQAPALPSEPDSVTMVLEHDGRNVELTLSYDGSVIRTEVSETYASSEAAAAAFVRIQQAMTADGYKAKS